MNCAKLGKKHKYKFRFVIPEDSSMYPGLHQYSCTRCQHLTWKRPNEK